MRIRRRKRQPLDLPAPQIVVVEDDAGVARAWVRALRVRFSEYPAVHAADLSRARDALDAAPTLAVFLDVGLGAEDGLDLLRELRAAKNLTPVLVVTGDDRSSRIRDAVALDAGIAFKPIESDDMLSFVDRAIDHPRMDDTIATLIAMESGLTTREAETLFVMIDYDSLEAVAACLSVGAATAKTHILHIYEKLGVASRTELHQLLRARARSRPPTAGPFGVEGCGTRVNTMNGSVRRAHSRSDL